MGGKPSPYLKWSEQMDRCLDEAQRRLKRSWAGGTIKVQGRKHTVIVRNQYCVEVRKEGGGTHPVRGYVSSYEPPRIVVVLHPDATVSNTTLCWEFGRLVLWHSGIKGTAEQETYLNRAKFRDIR